MRCSNLLGGDFLDRGKIFRKNLHPREIFQKENTHPVGHSKCLFDHFIPYVSLKTAFNFLETALKDDLSPIYPSLYGKIRKISQKFGKSRPRWDMGNLWENPYARAKCLENPRVCRGR